MEDLPANCEKWSLEDDRKLLAALQQFSASFLSRVNETERSLDALVNDTQQAEIRYLNASNRFRLLTHTHFVEQVRFPILYSDGNQIVTF